jgi:hypothetical protein
VTSEAKGYRHGKLVVTLLVIACVPAPIAGTAIWINNQVTKTDRYLRTVKPLASDPHIQAAIADNVTRTLFATVPLLLLTVEVVGRAPSGEYATPTSVT